MGGNDAMNAIDIQTPKPVMGLYDKPMWESISQMRMKLQCCDACGEWQYPPGPSCPHCLSAALSWKALSGNGKLVSWVIFHRHYLQAYPPPHNCIAVRLEEGPIVISNLDGGMPDNTLIDKPVRLTYFTMGDGVVLPRFEVV